MKCTKVQLSENFEKSKFIKFLQIKCGLAPLPFTLIFGGLFRLLYGVTALLWLFFIEKLSR